MKKTALVLGGHGFIGHHMARRLKKEGFWVRTVDIKEFPYGDLKSDVDDYVVGDLRDFAVCRKVFLTPENKGFDEIYQFAAWMGGAGVVFIGDYDAQIVHDSMLLNINSAEMAKRTKAGRIFYSSSACVYNQMNQKSTDNPTTAEESAYPAYPDSDYGFEKLMSERMYMAYARNYGLDVRITRFHNIFGPEGAWGNGREKSPAAMCRKVAEIKDGETMEVWGDGEQTRSFLYIDECLEAVFRLMHSDYSEPVNIGSDEMVSINHLVEMVKQIANKPNIKIKHVEGPLGVRGRNSDNRLIRKVLNWAPDYPLIEGIGKTYPWIKKQVESGVDDCPWSS
jgi:nucleoside-diphosphate-sugar epimerase